MKCFHPMLFLIVGWAATQTNAQDFAGYFEQTPIENAWHEVSIRPMGNGSYLWENMAGRKWSLHPIPGRSDRLSVGADCPYYPQYSVAIFTACYVVGPHAKYYRKEKPDFTGDFEGEFEKTPIENAWHEVSIRPMGNGSYFWENKAGRKWSLHPIPGQSDRLGVGADCPYYPQYAVAIFTAEYVVGPHDKYYRKDKTGKLRSNTGTGAVMVSGCRASLWTDLASTSNDAIDVSCCSETGLGNIIKTCGKGKSCHNICGGSSEIEPGCLALTTSSQADMEKTCLESFDWCNNNSGNSGNRKRRALKSITSVALYNIWFCTRTVTRASQLSTNPICCLHPAVHRVSGVKKRCCEYGLCY